MLPIFTISRTGLGLYSAYSRTGVIGLGDWAEAILRLAPRMLEYARHRDKAAADAMVSEAKGAVPHDTGRLLNGISASLDDDTATFAAHAVHDADGEDYARFVEFGTHAGPGTGVADEHYFGGDGASALHARRGHHNATPAEPYFFPAVREQLAKRGTDMASVVQQAGADEGFA